MLIKFNEFLDFRINEVYEEIIKTDTYKKFLDEKKRLEEAEITEENYEKLSSLMYDRSDTENRFFYKRGFFDALDFLHS